MNIGFLITARLKSTRLKYKVLKDLNGYSVIERVIQRAKKVKGCNDIVLCTSHLSQDLPLVKSSIKNDIFYYNGSPEDVLQRLLDAAELFQMDYIVGITADNPMFSIYHANLITDMFKANNDLDFIYTTGMPIGVNIYGMKTKALKTVCSIKEEIDTEIWGYLINRPEIFNVEEIIAGIEFRFENCRMTLDEINDYKFFERLYSFFPKEDVIDVLDAYRCLEENQDMAAINNMVIQKDLDAEIKERITKFYKDNKNAIVDLKNSIYSN
jgi:spore coat polysaccharide biosynthesis protein SpsF